MQHKSGNLSEGSLSPSAPLQGQVSRRDLGGDEAAPLHWGKDKEVASVGHRALNFPHRSRMPLKGMVGGVRYLLSGRLFSCIGLFT